MILKIRTNFKNQINQITTIRIVIGLNPYLKKIYYLQVTLSGNEYISGYTNRSLLIMNKKKPDNE